MKRKTLIIAAGIFLLMAGTAAATFFITVNSVDNAKQAGTAGTSVKKTANQTDSGKTEDDSNAGGDTITLTLYFSDSQAQYLAAEKREIAKTDDPAKAAVEELLKGPKTAGLAATLPTTMLVQSVKIENGIAIVDFGTAFNNLVPAGEAGEGMFIYSIVNTLTGMDGISGVKFAAGGQTPIVRNSRTDFSAVFARNENIIRE